MAGIGVFIMYLGYSVAYFGIDQIRGGNNGLLSLMKPGPFTEQPKDSTGADPGTVQGSSTPVPNKSGTPSQIGVPPAVFPTVAPPGAPKGSYGVDPDGNIYVKQGGKWVLYQRAGQTSPLKVA